MSTREYRFNNVTYKIGTIGWEGPKSFSQLPESTLPTYGLKIKKIKGTVLFIDSFRKTE